MLAERDKLFETLKKNDYYDIEVLQSVFDKNTNKK